jgi:hypothetical protein
VLRQEDDDLRDLLFPPDRIDPTTMLALKKLQAQQNSKMKVIVTHFIEHYHNENLAVYEWRQKSRTRFVNKDHENYRRLMKITHPVFNSLTFNAVKFLIDKCLITQLATG